MNPDERTGSDGRRGETGKDSRGGWRRWMGPGLVVLAVALVAGFGSYTVSLLTLIAEQGKAIQILREEAGRINTLYGIISAERSELLRLSGPSGKDGWKGTMLWEPGSGRAFLHITGIAKADTAMQYHLWLVGKGGPQSVTGFRVQSTGETSLFIERLPLPDDTGGTLVVTTDPDGSANFGSGSLVLAGSIQQ